jgi:hypothetical protein
MEAGNAQDKRSKVMSIVHRVRSTWVSCAIAAAFTLTPALAWAQKITTDWDKTATFTGYQTYALSRGQVPAGASPLVVQRIEAAIESELSALGLLKADKAADLTVAYHAATREDVSLQTWGYAPRWGGGQVDVNRVVTGTLMVDVVDAKAKKLVWRGTASDTVSDNPQKNEKKIHKAVEKMFEKYPTAAK